MTAKECIRTRRSIRQFQDKPIDHTVLEDIIETASYCPSWKHSQIARYLAIEGDLKDQIAAKCTSVYPNNGKIIASAPMLIAITVIRNRSGYERDGSYSTKRENGWQMYDAGIASQTFCLAAHEQGIGSVILGIFDEDAAAALLELPDDRDIIALIPIGYPAEEPQAPRRKSVEELVSYR